MGRSAPRSRVLPGYRRPCVDHEGLRNPVELWPAGGGRYHRIPRRRISSPDEVLPRWRADIEVAAFSPVHHDLLLLRSGAFDSARVPSWDSRLRCVRHQAARRFATCPAPGGQPGRNGGFGPRKPDIDRLAKAMIIGY